MDRGDGGAVRELSALPTFQENTAIAAMYGYELYNHKGKPWVIHRWTVRVSDEKGTKRPEKKIEHLQLDGEGWGETKTAQVVHGELRRLWREWVEWNDAMKGNA